VKINPQPAGAQAPATVRVWAATLVLGLGTLISHGFGLALVPAMLPRIADDLDVGYGLLGTAVTGGLAAYSIGAVTSARLLDRVPNRAGLFGSYALSGIGLLIAGAAVNPFTLTVAAAILGFIAPVSWALTLHVAGTTTARESRAAVMASASGSAALGVLINGVLVQTSDSVHTWRVSFAIAAALSLVPVVAGAFVYRKPIPRPARSSDPLRPRFALLSERPPAASSSWPASWPGPRGFPSTPSSRQRQSTKWE
jgi:MFS family permease